MSVNPRNRILLSVLLTVAITGCSSGGAKQSEAPKQGEKPTAQNTAPIRVGLIETFTGGLEAYAKETEKGFELGLAYATGGTNKVNGRPFEIIKQDTETKPQVAKEKALKLLDQEKVDILVGSTSSADVLAIMPLLEEFKKPLLVPGAVSDSITGAAWNRYTFRISRNSTMDAIAWAQAIGQKDAKIAILGEDYAAGREGVAAFKAKAEPIGAKIVYEKYAASATNDFTPFIEAMIASKPDYGITYWATANSPWKAMTEKFPPAGIKLSVGVLDLAHLTLYKGQVKSLDNSFAVYYYDLVKNPVNDWFVSEYQKKNSTPPSYSTSIGFNTAVAMVEALKKTGADTDSEKLIKALEGLSFDSVKGKMTIRPEDHQTLQEMYVVKLEDRPGVAWAVPVLVKTLSAQEVAPPITNKR